MNFTRFSSVILRSIRFVVIAFTCTLLFISNALPASANTASRAKPSEGSVQLDSIQRKSEEVTKAPPLSGEQTQREANKGLNEVQGDANKDEMYSPENAKATSIIDQVENALENVTGRD
jgi:flagellar motility protein MotE (MotC chaperone)